MREFIFREEETTIPVKGKRLVICAELVRCKDCKWYAAPISRCDNCGLPREQMFFCADGVAKDINVPDKEGR